MHRIPPAAEVDPFVLIVDDVPSLRDLLARLLARCGYRVREAGNGREALAVLQREGPPRIAFVDLEMPVMDGADFLRAAFGAGHAFPAVIVSGAPEAGETAAELGVGHIAKPYHWGSIQAWANNPHPMAA